MVFDMWYVFALESLVKKRYISKIQMKHFSSSLGRSFCWVSMIDLYLAYSETYITLAADPSSLGRPNLVLRFSCSLVLWSDFQCFFLGSVSEFLPGKWLSVLVSSTSFFYFFYFSCLCYFPSFFLFFCFFYFSLIYLCLFSFYCCLF